MIEAMDDGIGNLVQYLDEENLLDNTLLLFIFTHLTNRLDE